MKRLGFRVRIFENQRKADHVLQTIEKYVNKDQVKNHNAFGLAFMSHGNEYGWMKTYGYEDKDEWINVKQIIEKVTWSSKLAGKPKLFFFEGGVLLLFFKSYINFEIYF